MKFCKDCLHYAPNPNCADDPEAAICSRKTRTSIVTGETKYVYCEIERRFAECGQDAKFFEPVNVTEAA